ncbi:MAG: GEVED domain-containing protein, partial [Bacteroidia bacterium]
VPNCEKKPWKNTFTSLFLLLFTLLGFSDAFGQSPSVFTTSGTWTCPQGVTTIQVEAWGGGAGGRSTANTNGHVGGGGGGGAYARRNAITVVPGATYTITVGTGGAANTAGTASTATINGVTITAAGGSVGAASGTGTPAGGTGGTIAGSVGDVRFAGGNGGSGFGSGASGGSGSGGGGGSAAGSTGTGNNGNNATNTITPGNGGATVANFGGAGGNGGNNGNGFAATTNYGGGGGGAGHKNNTGGSGMNGAVIITFSCPVNIVNAGPDQTLTACATTATLAGSTVTAGTGTWTLISGTATITSPNSPTSGITGIVPGTSVTLRWTIDNGRCGSGFDEVTITSPIGPGCLSYCTPTGNLNCTLNDFISNVTYNTLNNTSTCAAGGYINYPATGSQTTTVIKGTTYNLSLSVGNGTGTHGAGVWIDWNQDGDFLDLNEFYLISNAIAASSTTVIPITVPLTAATGNLRMRIRYAYALTVTSTMSCTMPGTYGETEDYTITTIDPALCTIPLAQPTALNLTPAGSTISGGFIAASPAADNYLVVVSTSATPPSAPVNGTTYTVGGTLAPGYTIV